MRLLNDFRIRKTASGIYHAENAELPGHVFCEDHNVSASFERVEGTLDDFERASPLHFCAVCFPKGKPSVNRIGF